MVEKLRLPFPLLSDPRGDLIRSVGLWNGEEGVSEPAIVVLDGSGTVTNLYSGGMDFSDRPRREALLQRLDEVQPAGADGGGGSGPSVEADEAERETVRPEKPPMTLEALRPYYRGAHFATVAMQKKLAGSEEKEKVDGYQGLIGEYVEALRKTVKMGS